MFQGKTLLITGGTGSFGNTVLDRFLDTEIKEVRIFSRDEKKQDDMRRKYKNDKIKYYIGDVRNINSLQSAMRGVDYVFHAAALKQVPSCEFFPLEAVMTNVIGTDNVLAAASGAGVKRVICLSTDKAAYPINAMGTSKAMMEKVAIAKSRTMLPGDPVICVTRYGNVMASRGSVIPIFIDAIKQGKDVNVTDPSMTRFLMNLNEAVDLVLFAFEHGEQGDLFVQKSPACTIEVLAKSLLTMFDAKNSKIKVIGTRHGEKVHETLLTHEEAAKSEDMGSYYRVPADNRDLNYEKYLESGSRQITLSREYTSENTEQLDVKSAIDKLMTVDYVAAQLSEWQGRVVK
ncbi:MAG TPA: polysaccharide biosynthesis protein [Candidatus Saccharimonadales bacterium]|nr:polysaccharide biosynthesis protein [Candidatus Saccharimonadales bacterium]